MFPKPEAPDAHPLTAYAELDDEAGAELARELDFNEAGIGAGRAAGWIGVRFEHPGEDARSTADG